MSNRKPNYETQITTLTLKCTELQAELDKAKSSIRWYNPHLYPPDSHIEIKRRSQLKCVYCKNKLTVTKVLDTLTEYKCSNINCTVYHCQLYRR